MFDGLPCQRLESWEAIRPGGQQVRMLEIQMAQTFKAFKPPGIPASWQETPLIYFNQLNEPNR
jgi:hypothetical protein